MIVGLAFFIAQRNDFDNTVYGQLKNIGHFDVLYCQEKFYGEFYKKLFHTLYPIDIIHLVGYKSQMIGYKNLKACAKVLKINIRWHNVLK